MLKKLSVIAALAFVSTYSFAERIKLKCDSNINIVTNGVSDKYQTPIIVTIDEKNITTQDGQKSLIIKEEGKGIIRFISNMAQRSNGKIINDSNDDQWSMIDNYITDDGKKISVHIMIDRNSGILNSFESYKDGNAQMTKEIYGNCTKINTKSKLF